MRFITAYDHAVWLHTLHIYVSRLHSFNMCVVATSQVQFIITKINSSNYMSMDKFLHRKFE